MTVETFITNFAHLADAPNGVRKLRELILQLAVQGKLVPQDPEDEPASVLLERIKVKKERLIKEGVIKKSKKPSPINDHDKHFELPEKWEWARLGNTLFKLTDGTHHSPTNMESGEYKYVTAKNIKNDGIQLSNITYVTKEVHGEIFSRCNPEKGDLLYIKDGATTGIAAINNLDEPFSMLSSVALLKLPKEILNRYLLHVLRSAFFYDLMREGMSGVAITRVTLTKMNNALVPLPPLAEQHRIVAKVDQLMSLCDELEARQQKQQQRRVRLNNAALDALLTTHEPHEFADHWQRISTNFDLLYDHPETIAKLRAAILQLAVHGKLVPQDPNDEPASVLLEKIEAEKPELTQKKRGKRSAELAAVNPDKVPFDVPDNWDWARFGHIAFIASNLVKPEKHLEAIHVAPDNIEKGNGKLLPCLTVKVDKVRSSNHQFFPGQILYS
jgi:type I restriction enzyme S subunit